jgi:hypothetical protein
MENANKTRVRFGWRANGGFLEGVELVPFAQLSASVGLPDRTPGGPADGRE